MCVCMYVCVCVCDCVPRVASMHVCVYDAFPLPVRGFFGPDGKFVGGVVCVVHSVVCAAVHERIHVWCSVV